MSSRWEEYKNSHGMTQETSVTSGSRWEAYKADAGIKPTPTPTPVVTPPSTPKVEEGGNLFERLTGNLFGKSAQLQAANAMQSVAALTRNEAARNVIAPLAQKQQTAAEERIESPSFGNYIVRKATGGFLDVPEGVVNTGSYWAQGLAKGYQMQAANAMKSAAATAKNEYAKDILTQQADKQQTEALKNLKTPTKTVFNFADNYMAKTEEMHEDKDYGVVGNLAGDVAQGVGGMIPRLAAKGVPVLGDAITLLSSFGNAMQGAKKEGKSDAEALPYALATAVAEVAIEKVSGLGDFGGKGFGDKAVDSIANGIAKAIKASPAAQKGLRLLVSGIAEGAEETVTEYANRLINAITIKTDERSLGETTADAFYNGLVGSVVGTLSSAANPDTYKTDNNKPTEGKAPTESAKTEALTQAQISPSDGVSENVTNVTSENGSANPDYQGKGISQDGAQNANKAGAQSQNPMRTGQTIASAPATTSEGAALISDLYASGAMNYLPTVDADLANTAAAEIERDGWNDSIKNWTADVRSGKVSPQLVAKGAQLLNNAGQAGTDAKAYADLVLDYSNLLHTAGQSLQAARILNMLTPEGRLYGIQKSVQKMADEVGSRYDVHIPQELIDKYGNATTDAERDSVIGEMQKAVAKRLPSTLTDKWTALRYVNMLGNFKTQQRNILSNLGNLALYRVKDEVGAAIETIANLIKPASVERTKSFIVSPAWRKAAWNDYKAVQDAALGEGKYNDSAATDSFGRGVDRYKEVFKNSGEWGTKKDSPTVAKVTRKVTDALWKVPEAYRRVTNFAMEYGDIIFSRSAYSHSLAGFLNSRGVTPEQFNSGNVDPALLEAARVYAIQQAQEVTLRDRNAFSDAISKAFRGKKTPKFLKVITEGASPFRRTPANAMVRFYEYSPFSFVEAAIDGIKKSKGDTTITGSDIIDEISKGITGTGMLILGYILRDHGLLRASGDEDEEELDAFLNLQDFSLVVPGKGSYTMDWASSSAFPLFMGAKLSELFEDKDITAAEIIGALEDMPEPILEMSMLSGLNDAIEQAQYSDNPLSSMLASFALNYYTQGLTNTFFGQLERANEPNRMTAYVDTDNPLPEGIQRRLGKLSAKVPGWDYQQAEYLDEFGETESNGSAAWRYFENLLSPGYWEPEKKGDVYDFIKEVHETTGKKAFPDTTPPSEVTYEEESFPLSISEQRQYQQTRGAAARELIEAAAQNKEYKDLTAEEQKDVISRALSFATETATTEALKQKGVALKPDAVADVKADMSAYDYINYLVEEAGRDIPPTYSSAPMWHKFEIAYAALPQELAESMIIAQGGKTGQKIVDAANAGVPLELAIAYYRANNERRADGKDPEKADKLHRINALGLTQEQRGILNRIFG